MEKALVLFSGGQDSATCLAWALDRFSSVETIGFDYGQDHRVELDCRRVFLSGLISAFPRLAARLGDDHVMKIPAIRPGEAPGTSAHFVPGRNLIFLTMAAALAARTGARHLVGGMCSADDAGFPDCRADTISALEKALNLGMGSAVTIHTPLMRLTKAATWAMAHRLGGVALLELIIVDTHTCYRGDRSVAHAWGFGCGVCPSCKARADGWDAWRAGECSN